MSDPNEISGPIPVVVTGATRLGMMTRLFTWMTVACLSASVLVSLLAVTWDRNDLRTQIREQSLELTCRAEATSALNSALTNQFVILGEQNTVLGQIVVAIGANQMDLMPGIIEDLTDVNIRLDQASENLNEAIIAQRESIVTCAS